MPEDLRFHLGPTQYKFVTSRAHLIQLMGPMGEGKTFAGVAGIIAHAQYCGGPIRCALVRDTFQNIKTSTIPDIRDYLKAWVRFSDGGKHMTILSTPRVDCDFFGIDDEASISKLQGPQYACIWLEEPAPIYEKSNAGLPREVLNLAIARAARQQGTIPRVQISQNPADEDHWTSLLAEEPDGEYARYEDPETGEVFVIIKKTLWIPPGENKYLPGLSRAANLAAFKDDPAKMARYIEGQIASVHRGKKVTPAYNQPIHFSRLILPVHRGELIQMWDSWQHPTCIIAQYNPVGQLTIHDVIAGEGLGTKELIEEKLRPFLNSPKYKGKIKSWRLIGDQTMRIADQSSTRSVTSKVIEEEFKKFKVRFEPGPAHWRAMKEPLNRCFKRLLNEGRPAVVLSRSAVQLHRSLRGGWHYKVDNSGNVLGDKPVKDQYSHAGDAFANGIAVLMPYEVKKKLKAVKEEVRKRRALSYRGGGYGQSTVSKEIQRHGLY